MFAYETEAPVAARAGTRLLAVAVSLLLCVPRRRKRLLFELDFAFASEFGIVGNGQDLAWALEPLIAADGALSSELGLLATLRGFEEFDDSPEWDGQEQTEAKAADDADEQSDFELEGGTNLGDLVAAALGAYLEFCLPRASRSRVRFGRRHAEARDGSTT